MTGSNFTTKTIHEINPSGSCQAQEHKSRRTHRTDHVTIENAGGCRNKCFMSVVCVKTDPSGCEISIICKFWNRRAGFIGNRLSARIPTRRVAAPSGRFNSIGHGVRSSGALRSMGMNYGERCSQTNRHENPHIRSPAESVPRGAPAAPAPGCHAPSNNSSASSDGIRRSWD